MPELPEVEITRENLERWLRGRRIVRARVLDPRVLRGQSTKLLERRLRGAVIQSLARRGKYLIWNLGRRPSVVAHLGMTGEFLLRRDDEAEPAAARVVLGMRDGRRLIFVDTRRLGFFCLLDDTLERKLASLGTEPLSDEFSVTGLRNLLAGARLSVKAFLMDQRRVAGIGNIHAAEALYRAGIHPERKAADLERREVTSLHRAIRATLSEALRRDRREELGWLREGSTENRFLVYGHAGEACPRCREVLRRLIQSGRSTFYCPGCQRLPRNHRRAPMAPTRTKRLRKRRGVRHAAGAEAHPGGWRAP